MAKPNRRVIGRLVPQRQSNMPASFETWLVGQEEYNHRLGLIPASISPAELNRIKTAAAYGDLGPLYELYDKMEATDSRYGGLVGSLKASVSGMPLKVIAAEGTSAQEQALAEDMALLVEEQLAALDTHNLMKEFADAYINGAKVFENRFRYRNYPYGKRLVLIDKVRPIAGAALMMDRQHNSPTYGELMIRLDSHPQGKPVSHFPRNKLFVLEDGMGEGFYDAMGVARKCLAWWITKIYAQLWWTEFVEVYGQPLRIGRYPEGVSPSSKATMEKFLKMLGKSAYGLFPQGMDVQLIEANKSGTVTTYQDLMKYASDEMAIAILGQVDTMGGRKEGSYAKTKVLDGVRYEILRDVAQIIAKGFHAIVQAVIEVNYGPDANPRLFPKVMPILVNPTDGKTKAETFEILQRTGVVVPIDHIHEQMGVPRAKTGEKVLIRGRVVEYEEGIEEKLAKEMQANGNESEQSNPASEGNSSETESEEN